MKYSKVNRAKYRSGLSQGGKSRSYIKSVDQSTHIRQKSSVNPNMQVNVDITPDKKIQEVDVIG